MVLNVFNSGIFPIFPIEGTDNADMLACVAQVSDHNVSGPTNLKALTSKQRLQILPTVLAQAKAGNTSENVLIQIFQIMYSLHQAKETTKKVYNNTMKGYYIYKF